MSNKFPRVSIQGNHYQTKVTSKVASQLHSIAQVLAEGGYSTGEWVGPIMIRLSTDSVSDFVEWKKYYLPEIFEGEG